jgi:hypothetical protein
VWALLNVAACLGALLLPGRRVLVAQVETSAEIRERSGLWFRFGIDFGTVRVDSAHSAGGGGAHLAAGWTLSPNWTVGARAVASRSGTKPERSHTLVVGPEVAWYPMEEETLALRGGISLLDIREYGTWLSPDGASVPRVQDYSGPLAHVALTAGQYLSSGVLAQLGIELGYAPFGRWHDTSPYRVTGRPWTTAFSVTFGFE